MCEVNLETLELLNILKMIFIQMKGTCEICGTKDIEVEQKNISGQLKYACNNCF